MHLTRWLLTMVIVGVLGLQAALAEPPTPAIGADFLHIMADAQRLVGPQPAADTLQLKSGDTLLFLSDTVNNQGIAAYSGYARACQRVLDALYPELKLTMAAYEINGFQAQKIDPLLAREATPAAGRQTWVFLLMGMQDATSTPTVPVSPELIPVYKARVADMAEKVLATGARLVLVTPPYLWNARPSMANDKMQCYADAMQQLAADKRLPIVDVHALLGTAMAAAPRNVSMMAGVRLGSMGDAVCAVGLLRALGVPDAAVATADLLPAIQFRAFGMRVVELADLLGVPPTRLLQPEFAGQLAF